MAIMQRVTRAPFHSPMGLLQPLGTVLVLLLLRTRKVIMALRGVIVQGHDAYWKHYKINMCHFDDPDS